MGFMRKKSSNDYPDDSNTSQKMVRGGSDPMEPDADDMGTPNTNRMGSDNDADDRGGFMSKGSAPKKKRGFMRNRGA